MSNPTPVVDFSDDLAGFLARQNQFGETNQQLVQQKFNKKEADGSQLPIYAASSSNSRALAQWGNLVDDFMVQYFTQDKGLTETVYEVDFATLSAQDFVAGGDKTYVIDGNTWTAASTANADTFGLDGSTGIVFDADTTNTDYSSAAATAARLFIPIGSLLGNSYNPLATYLLEFRYTSISMAVNNNRLFFGMSRNDGTANVRGGGRYTISGEDRIYAQTQTTLNSGEDTPLDVFAMRIDPNGVYIMGDAWGGDWPDLYTYVGGRVSAPALDGAAINDWTSSLVLAFPTGEVGGNMAATLREMRVRRFSR